MTSVRERAIQAYKKAISDNSDWNSLKIVVVKSRSKKIIKVFREGGLHPLSWSYKNGKLHRVAS